MKPIKEWKTINGYRYELESPDGSLGVAWFDGDLWKATVYLPGAQDGWVSMKRSKKPGKAKETAERLIRALQGVTL